MWPHRHGHHLRHSVQPIQLTERGAAAFKWSRTGRQVNPVAEVREGDRRTDGVASERRRKSGSRPGLTVRLAGIRPQRHTGLFVYGQLSIL